MFSKKGRGAAMFAAALGVLIGAVSGAQTVERKPTFSYSLANKKPGRQADGPLFKKANDAFAAARKGDGSAFKAFLARDAKLELMVRSATGPGPDKLPFDLKTVRAASSSCLGPFSYDEGSSWTQLSWICRVDGEGPLTKIMTFRDSPELTLTVWFEGGRIKQINAMEPFPIPGRLLVGMGAYEEMKPKR